MIAIVVRLGRSAAALVASITLAACVASPSGAGQAVQAAGNQESDPPKASAAPDANVLTFDDPAQGHNALMEAVQNGDPTACLILGDGMIVAPSTSMRESVDTQVTAGRLANGRSKEGLEVGSESALLAAHGNAELLARLANGNTIWFIESVDGKPEGHEYVSFETPARNLIWVETSSVAFSGCPPN